MRIREITEETGHLQNGWVRESGRIDAIVRIVNRVLKLMRIAELESDFEGSEMTMSAVATRDRESRLKIDLGAVSAAHIENTSSGQVHLGGVEDVKTAWCN
jgi:hypothetical protein